jgi:hypothetical protein
MKDWREKLRAALPERTWQEILKRLRYLGNILEKRRIIKSEGDPLGMRLWVYISRYTNLPEGSEGEEDEADAIAHMEAYQRAADGVAVSVPGLSESEIGEAVDFECDTQPPVGDSVEGTQSGSPVRTSSVADSGTEKGNRKLVASVVAWTSDEDEVLRVGFEAGQSWREIADFLPGRTLYAAKARGNHLNLKRRQAGTRWTDAEKATLRAGVEARESWVRIAERLPGRSGGGTRNGAKRLGIERSKKQVSKAWTEAEEETILAGVAAGKTSSEIAKDLPGRTLDAVEKRRILLREGAPLSKPWTEAEDAALRASFASGKKWEEIAAELPGRRVRAVRTRGSKELGLWRRVPVAAA